jgi:hypothetical protein
MNVGSMPSLYVYYRIPWRNVIKARAAAACLGTVLEAHGVERPRLMQRPDADAEGRQTWMEIYACWDDKWAPTIERSLVDCGLAALIEGPRHSELFIDIPS